MRWLALLLLLPLASAGPVPVGQFGMDDHFTVTHGVLFSDAGGLVGHQNVQVVYSNATGVLLETHSIHEHDGLALMRWTAGNASARLDGSMGGESWGTDLSVTPNRPPNSGSLASLDGTELFLDGARLGIEKSNSRGIKGTWVVRDEMGPILMAGIEASGFFEHDLAETHVARPLAAEMTLYGRIGSRIITTEGTPPASAPAPPAVDALLLEACGAGVVLDPPTPVAGTMLQVVLLDADNRAAGPADYELVRIDTPQEQLMHRWSSTAPFAETAFRLPEGSHELRITTGADTCKVALEAAETATGTAPLLLDVTAFNGTLNVTADVAAEGHYEYHVAIHLDNGQTTGSRLVWEGKLHGHDGPVSLQAYQLPNATYEVVVDAWPQGATPAVENGPQGHRARLQMTYPTPAITPEKQSPLPALWPMAAILLALLARRR